MGARIEEHPILGKQEKGRLVTFYFDGKELTGYEGEPIAAALKAQGVMIHRYTKKEHKPRDRKSTRLNSSHRSQSRMPSSA